MKNNHKKSLVGLFLIGLFLTIIGPTDVLAQRNAHKTKSETKKAPVASSPVKHYNNAPKRGAQTAALPRNTVALTHRNLNYHYDNGVFYRPVNGRYVVTAPPVGIHISLLPPNPFRVVLSGRTYYYYYGTYYLPASGGGYQVVAPPVGAMIDALPNGYEVFDLDGLVYYRLDETYYKAIVEPNGNVVYEVVRV